MVKVNLDTKVSDVVKELKKKLPVPQLVNRRPSILNLGSANTNGQRLSMIGNQIPMQQRQMTIVGNPQLSVSDSI